MTIHKLTLPAPAKLNLTLKVLGRCRNGLHELDAATVPLDLADTVTVTPRRDRRCVNAWQLPGTADQQELGLRAARALQAVAQPDRGVTIAITKRIPAGAGLGGGSSNAAAVLVACNRLWELGWSLPKLAHLGAQLGSDVPFFVYCRQARICGGGEILRPLRPAVLGWCVVVVPPVHCATRDVFATFDRGNLTINSKSAKITKTARQRNDLLCAALRLHPSLTATLHDLYRAAGMALMSGSGSACFAPVATRREGLAIVQRLARENCQAYVCRFMRGRVRSISLGSSQAVRQRVLIPSCVGSNPTSPAVIAS